MSSGWHREPLRHSNARKYGRAGGTYADKYPSKIKLPKKTNYYFDAEDLSDRQLMNLSEKQVEALEKGKTYKSDRFILKAREEQIRDWEERYKLLAEGKALDNSKELEEYRSDKANYLQYLNESARTDAYLKKVKGTDSNKAVQLLGEEVIKELETESPKTVKFLRENPECKVYFVKRDDFERFLVDSRGDTRLEASATDGMYDSLRNRIYVSVDFDINPDGSYVMTAKDRAVAKEVLVHETAHAKNFQNFWNDTKNQWRTLIKPQLKERMELFKNKGKMTPMEYNNSLDDLNRKWGGYFKYPGIEYNAYHYQGRVRKQVHRSYVDDVKELEKRGDYSLDNYRVSSDELYTYYTDEKSSYYLKGLKNVEDVTYRDY